MRIQPETIIQKLEADNSRLAKEQILKETLHDDVPEFWQGVQWALDKLHTFGVKQVPIKDTDDGPQGLPWDAFCELADQLAKRKLTGHAARDAILLQMACATKEQWNDWYRRILIKDLRCGTSISTINKVVKKAGYPQYAVPVFECQLAQDSKKHEKKVCGEKIIQHKLDGVRALVVVNYEMKSVNMFSRNGKELVNFPQITEAIAKHIDEFGRSYVIDGEIMSADFQTLMTQVQRKSNVETTDAHYNIFDIIPLFEFNQGIGTMGQTARCNFLDSQFKPFLEDTGLCTVVPWELVDLDTPEGDARLQQFNAEAIAAGFEGIMIKDPKAKYECKRSSSWLKLKPFIQVSLPIIDVEEGTGRNAGRFGAAVCSGVDSGKTIQVNVGSGFSDKQRDEFWQYRTQIIGQIAEIRADAMTLSRDSDDIWSLRFPRFVGFRGFEPGEKI